MSDVGCFSPDELEDMEIHPSMRRGIQHFVENWSEPYVG